LDAQSSNGTVVVESAEFVSITSTIRDEGIRGNALGQHFRIPDSLSVSVSESFEPVVSMSYPHRLGLSHGVPVDPVKYVLEVGPAMLRAGRRTTRPTSEWAEAVEEMGRPEEAREEQLVLWWADEEPMGPERRIVEWSLASRRNMVRTFACLDWGPFAVAGVVAEMVTLTYPGDWRASAPDGRTVKRHLERFRSRWERKWGPLVGVWKMEFQQRGAPHLHLYVARPVSGRDADFRRWVSEAWFEVVGSGDIRHLRAGTGVDRQFCARAVDVRRLCTYFSKHNSKYAGKSEQNEVPAGFYDVGRFWGVWGMEKAVERVELTRRDYHQVVRILRQLQRAARPGRRRLRAMGGEAGLWTLTGSGPRVAVQLARWLRDAELERRPGQLERTGEVL
jgi:hypothetical protein